MNVRVIGQVQNPWLEAGGPTAHWLGPEMLVELTVEGRNFMALADSGSQVNTITPALVQQYGFPVLPLEDLVDYLVNLVGLGGMRTSPLGFVILHIQVWGVAGYDEDVVFLVVPDESDFGRRVPLVMGTCTISRLINVIHESEIDNLAMPWSTARLARLLSCQLGTVVPGPEGAETQEEGACGGSPEVNIDELVTVWESVCLGPFQTEIIEGQVKPLLGSTSYVMITPLKVEGRQCKTKPLSLGLHVLHVYTRLKNGSGRVSLVVRNVSDSQIFLKKGAPVERVVSTMLVSPTELSPEMEATLGEESRPEPLSVAVRQEKLLEKLNLDGLAHWSPENAVAARELVLAYHDVFTLESNELGCTSAIEHKISIRNEEPFKEWFRRIPPPFLEEVRASLRDMLEAGAIHPSQSPWCNAVVLVQKKDGTLRFCVDFRRLNARTKKDSYPLPWIQEALESMAGSVHFSLMDCVVFKRFCEFNLKLNPSKCSFFQSEIMYLAHHVSWRGILPSWENMWAMQEFPMLETYTQVCAFCGLAGHYRRFIKVFTNIAHPLYDVLGKEVKMGLVDLPPKAQEAMAVLKGKVQSAPVLVFPNFKKPFLLETDASKEGLGAVLSQKQNDGQYHPIAFGSHSLTPAEKNYHSSKLEFLALKWSVTEHFKEYLAYVPLVVRTDNNPLMYVLTMPNLDRCVGALASFQFELKYQKGTDNGAADVLSWVPINHSWQTVQSLLEGAIVGASDRREAKANEGLLEEHERLS